MTQISSFFKNLKLDYPNSETTKASRRFVKSMKQLQVSLSNPTSKGSSRTDGALQDFIPQTTPFNIQFLQLLRRIFVYDPKRRITAREALDHPWFRETVRDDGTEAVKLRNQREDEERRRGGFDTQWVHG